MQYNSLVIPKVTVSLTAVLLKTWRTALCFLLLSVVPVAPSLGQSDTTGHDVKITVDPRIELMGAVQLLTDYPLVTDYEFPYKQDVRAYFSSLKSHPAAQLFEEMDGKGFAFALVPKVMLALTRPPELTNRFPYPDRSVSTAGGPDSLRQFVGALRDFARKSDFQAFFDAHCGTYQAMVDSARGTVGEAVGTLRDYLGVSLKNTTVVLGPLLHDGGFGARYDTPGGLEAYALIGPASIENGLPTFGAPQRLAGLTWHELSHTVVNRLTQTHWNRLKSHDSLLDPIAEQMDEAGYGNDWEIVVNEHVIRAIEVRLVFRRFGKKAGYEKLRDEKKEGFRYVEPLARELQTYENNRDKYPTLADFYPRLIDVFENVAAGAQ